MGKFFTISLLLILLVSTNVQAQDSPIDSTTQSVDSTSILDAQRIPVFTATSSDDGQGQGSQDVSGLLQSSRDVFVQAASFNFSNAGYQLRGLSSENNAVMINGVKMNDYETGFASWSTWGGLNDITRNTDIVTGMGVSDYNFGGLQGTTNLEFRPSSFRKGNSLIYGNGNRSFRHRISYTYSTGMMENGWAFTASASRRYSTQGYIPGTFFDGYSYFLGIEKKINEKHSFSFIGFGAPTTQGKTSSSTQEAYDLLGSNFYNPNWGLQQGKIRNANTGVSNEPFMQLNHYYNPTEKTSIHASLFGQISHIGRSRLNYYNTKQFQPNYYKFLPSYLLGNRADTVAADKLEDEIKKDPNLLQLDWDYMYQANYNNLYKADSINGGGSGSITGRRARYFISEDVINQQVYGYNIIVKHDFSPTLHVSGGLNLSQSTSQNFRRVTDLLGADFVVDVNQFAERLSSSTLSSQSNLGNVNHIIDKDGVANGEKFGYNYDMHVQRAELFGTVEYKLTNLEFKGAAQASFNNYWRTGYFQNGIYPEASLGNSDKIKFTNYGLKAGVVYKLTGRHFLTVNAMLASRPPLPRNVYVSPASRSTTQDKIESEQVLSGDANYIVRFPKFKLRATVFYTEIKYQMLIKQFFHDELNSFVNYAMTGVGTLYTGTEIGADAKIYRGLEANVIFSKADYIYTSRPSANVTTDNASTVFAKDRTVYLTNYKIGGNPQTVSSFGLLYRGAQNYTVGASVNYYTDVFIEMNPDRRTTAALEKYVESDPQWKTMLDQQQFAGGYIINASAGKSINFKGKNIYINLVVNNVLDNQKLITGGSEQLRYDVTDINKFPPKITYHLGRTYNAQISFRF